MKKRFTNLFACLIAVAFALPGFAQSKYEMQKIHKREVQKRILEMRGQAVENHELLDQMAQPTKGVRAAFKQAMQPVAVPQMLKTPLTARQIEMLGSCLMEDYGTLVSFSPATTITLNKLAQYGYDNVFTGGSALIGDTYYGMAVQSLAGMTMLTLYVTDLNTLKSEEKYVFEKTLMATETAKDPNSNTVFGQFYNADMTKLEWGIIDYAAQKRTTIKASERRYVALAYAKDGMVYGVAVDGKLYKIEPTTGIETPIGDTGVKLLTANKKVFPQSADIDPVSGTFYWAATDANEVSKLYTVNLQTGLATEVGTLPNSISGLAIPGAAAQDGAPDQVSNVTYDFVESSLTGKVTFTAPTQTYGGTPLDKAVELKYVIYIDGQQAATGKVLPGAVKTADVTVTEDGLKNFKIVVSNAVGNGAKFNDNHYVGFDVPYAPENLVLTHSTTGHVKLTWTAPMGVENNGFMGPITYNVIREYNGTGTIVASGLKALTYEEDLTAGEYSSYKYIVESVNGRVTGDYNETEPFFFGSAIEPNYVQPFDTEASATLWADVNPVKGSYNEWKWDEDNQYMKCGYSFKGKSDNWLISPPIHLKAGYTYFVKYDVITPAGSEEKIEVKWGQDAGTDFKKLDKELMPITAYKEKRNVTHSIEKEIKVGPEGNYNFGFHAVSEKGSYFIAIDNFQLLLGPLPTAPDSVTNIKAVTEASGLDQATITFNAPTKNRKGEPITSLTKIEVKNGERLVGTIQPAEVGKQYSITDPSATHGENTYSVFAYNENGIGEKATVNVKVGQDRPGKFKLTAIDQLNSVKLTWTTPTAAEGGFVNPDGITYYIYKVTPEGEMIELGRSAMGAKEYVIENFKTIEGPQTVAYFAVVPKNASGNGKLQAVALLVGKPYQMPYKQSFKNNSDQGQYLQSGPSEAGDEWFITSSAAADNDGGAMCFKPKAAGKALALFGKISLRGAVKPQLSFDYKCEPASQRQLKIMLKGADGSVKPLYSKDFATSKEDNGWHRAIVNIPAEYTEMAYVQILLFGIAADPTKETAPIYIDNINIIDPLPTDAAVQLVAPKKTLKGHEVKFNAEVTNCGTTTLDEKTMVKIFVNGNEVSQHPLTKKLATTDMEEIPVTYQTSLKDAGTQFIVKAQVVTVSDADKRNDVSEKTITFNSYDVPQPQNVTTTGNNKPTVGLRWEAPQIETPSVVETFEDYDSWTTSFGDWTLLDMDKGYAISPAPKEFQYPHNNEQYAFIIAEPNEFFSPDSKLYNSVQAHGGQKYAMNTYQVNSLTSGATPINSNNWMISPILPGKSQTINFWAKNISRYAETFDVLYSNAGNPRDIRKFIKIGDTYTVKENKWTNIIVDLPEGARYFAIHHNTSSKTTTMFMIDDISFTKGNLPLSYNIYRDGIFIGNSSTLEFNDGQPGVDGNHTYSVAAVYADGSVSAPVDVNVVTDIHEIEELSSDSYNVYTIDGVQVLKNAKDLKSLKRGLYIVNGKKVIINN